MAGALEKLKIQAFTDAKLDGKPVKTFEVMFNPNAYSLKYSVEYDKEQAKGASAHDKRYASSKAQDFSLQFTLDGTGASGPKVEVADKVKAFLDTCYTYDGKIHRTRYLRIIWGTLLFDCVFKSADVNYTLFKPNGHPLRAKISATFNGYVHAEKMVAEQRKASPDVTHVHRVVGRESLPLLCHRYYGDQRHYLRVAAFNGLKNFRWLEPGQRISFPPLARLPGGTS